MLVAVPIIVADDLQVGAIAVHAHGEAANPDVTVIAATTGDVLQHIRAAHIEVAAGLVDEVCPHVALVEVPLAVRTEGRAVQAVVVLTSVEAGEQDFLLVDGRVEDAVAVNVGVDDQVRRLGDHNLAINMGHAQGGFQVGILSEDCDLIGLTGPSGVLEDHDTIALLTTALLTTVVDALGDVHATSLIEIDVSRVGDLRRSRPDGDLEAFRHREEFGRYDRRAGFEIDRFIFVRTSSEDCELHISRTGLTVADGAAVIDADLGAEGLRRSGQVEGDEGRGMRTDAAGVFLAGNLHRLAVVVLADAGRTKRLGFLPLQFREIDHGAVRQDDLGLDPVGPVAGVAIQLGDHEEELLRAVEVSREVHQTELILGEHAGRLDDRLRRGGGSQCGETKKGQQGGVGLA